jgi:YbgC/YbaW family acyl-CoA thioester hydrolase
MSAPQHKDFRCLSRLRVRWAEVDIQKVVFNPHYLTYIDCAFTDYWRALALPYEQSMHQLGGEPFLRKVTVEYHASAHLDEQLEVGMRCVRIGTSSMGFEGGIYRNGTLLVSAELVYVFANPATQTATPVPQALREAFLGYEAWEPMVHTTVGTWSELGEAAQALRTEVFVHEQGIALEVERDAEDAQAVHALVRNRLGLPVATGRLLQQAPGVGRIGRMAVKQVLRGSRLGRDVLRALMQAASDRGDHEVVLHAQHSALPFYKRLGFVPRGEPFEEAGIVHQEMHHALPLRPGQI